MGDVINLRLARKRFARKAAEDKASENRALHGRTKAEKQAQQQEADRLSKQVDGARREGIERTETAPEGHSDPIKTEGAKGD